MNALRFAKQLAPLRGGLHRTLPGPAALARRGYVPSPFRRDPINDLFREFENTTRSMARVFDDMERQWFGRSSRLWRPWTQQWFERELPIETKSDGSRLYRARFDVSGFSPENVKVSLNNRAVTIRATHESSSEKSGIKQSRDYVYEFSLPEEAELDQIKSYIDESGTLNIEAALPKLEPAKPKVHELKIERTEGEVKK